MSLFVVVCHFSLFLVCCCVSFVGSPGGPDGPGCQCGPGGQGCLDGQGGPGEQVCQCIWFTCSKQSDYLENLRCHACDTLTDRAK